MIPTDKAGFAKGGLSFPQGKGWAVPACTTEVASSSAPGRSVPPLLPETRTVVWWVG